MTDRPPCALAHQHYGDPCKRCLATRHPWGNVVMSVHCDGEELTNCPVLDRVRWAMLGVKADAEPR